MWSWVLSGTGLLALYLLGNKSQWGFVIGLASDALWGVYSYQTHQWGFIIACGVYAALHIRNLLKWTREETKELKV